MEPTSEPVNFELRPISDQAKDFLDGTDQFVEATDDEKFMLWKEWHREESIDWKDHSTGIGVAVAKFAGHDVFVTFTKTVINGKNIVFYNPTSIVVNWRAVEDWINQYGPETSRDNNGKVKKVDVKNFRVV